MSLTETAASVAARAFFYPSLAWNIARNRLQETWHWWDEITPNVVLGAIPFYSTLDELKKLGIQAVVTLNETFEVFITSEQYQDSGFQHLHIPTVDFLYAPPIEDLHRGADFIHGVAAHGGKTYVHCKAGRGRSTTLVLCYLIKYCGQTPEEAYTFVRDKRPQVCLAQGQWTSVCGFYVSCHPGKGLRAEDFPHPSLLPIAASKQGSDGPEALMYNDEACLTPLCKGEVSGLEEESSETQIQSEQEEFLSTMRGQAGFGASCTGGWSESHAQDSRDTVHDGDCGRNGISTEADMPANGTRETIVLDKLGSTAASTSESDVSLASIATALSTCCIHPRGQSDSIAHYGSQGNAGKAPPRSSSPAIEIPGTNQTKSTPRADVDAEYPSSGSKTSITLEPSGSLPGYIRIAPPQSKVQQEEPNFKATLSSVGFGFIDDWADLGQCTAN